MGGLPEGAVIGGSEFRAVGHDGDVRKTVFIQSRADGLHPSVHHIGRRDHVRSCLRQAHRHLRKKRQRLIVQDTVPLHQAAVAVGGVFAQTDIHDAVQLRKVSFDLSHRPLGDPVRRIGLAPHLVLMGGNAEQQDAGNAAFPRFFQNAVQPVQRILKDSGHGGHRILQVFFFRHKNGIDEILRMQPGLPHHFSDYRIFPQSAKSLHHSSPLFCLISVRSAASGVTFSRRCV